MSRASIPEVGLDERIRRAIEEAYPSAPPFIRLFAWFVYPEAIVRVFVPTKERRGRLDFFIYLVGICLLTSIYLFVFTGCSLGLLISAEITARGGALDNFRKGIVLAGWLSTFGLCTALWLMSRWDPANRRRFREGAWEVWGVFITALFFLSL